MNTGFIEDFKNIFGQVTLLHSSAIKKHKKRNKVRSFSLLFISIVGFSKVESRIFGVHQKPLVKMWHLQHRQILIRCISPLVMTGHFITIMKHHQQLANVKRACSFVTIFERLCSQTHFLWVHIICGGVIICRAILTFKSCLHLGVASSLNYHRAS